MISWAAATDKTSAIAGYEVQFRKNGGPWYAVKCDLGQGPLVRPHPRVQRHVRDPHPGARRSRQLESVGRPPPRSGPRSSTIGAPSVNYTASWVKAELVGRPSRDTLHRSSKRHAKLSYTFTGRAISAIAPLGPGRAKVRVYIDGVYQKTVDLRRAGHPPPAGHLRARRSAASGKHKITLEIVSGGVVQLDAFIVLK